MSQENVEIVRRYFEEAPGGPAEQLSAWIAGFWDPDADYYPPRKWPESRPCHGREEIVRFITEYRAAWDHYRLVVKDARAVGDDRVLVHAQASAKGRGSGVALEGDIYYSFWLRHGRFIRREDHLTAKGALQALGLSGETLGAAGLRE
jgi:SnoaL-like domain